MLIYNPGFCCLSLSMGIQWHDESPVELSFPGCQDYYRGILSHTTKASFHVLAAFSYPAWAPSLLCAHPLPVRVLLSESDLEDHSTTGEKPRQFLILTLLGTLFLPLMHPLFFISCTALYWPYFIFRKLACLALILMFMQFCFDISLYYVVIFTPCSFLLHDIPLSLFASQSLICVSRPPHPTPALTLSFFSLNY